GTIGMALARRLADGVPGLTLACVAARDEEKARGWLDEEGIEVPIVALGAMPAHADLAVECAPAKIIERICRPMLGAGKQVMVLSCGALLPRPELLELAKQHSGRIIVPTGGLLGLDAVAAAAEGTIHSVRMTTRKPPNGLPGAPHPLKIRRPARSSRCRSSRRCANLPRRCASGPEFLGRKVRGSPPIVATTKRASTPAIPSIPIN